MNNKKCIKELKLISNEIRKLIVKSVYTAQSGHPGGSLSAADFITVLFQNYLKHDPKNPKWEERDLLIFSKGHCSPLLYSELAYHGYFPIEELDTFRRINSRLQGHPAMYAPGVEVSSGSLGQGLSVGAGAAAGLKMDNSDRKVYVLLGDGEIQEGSIWEAAMFSAHNKLDNLCAYLDYNNLQIDGKVSDINDVAPLVEKWISFGWDVHTIDGHNYDEIIDSLDNIFNKPGKPHIIIGKSVKGKGVSFMTDIADWHGKAPNKEQYELAVRELDEISKILSNG